MHATSQLSSLFAEHLATRLSGLADSHEPATGSGVLSLGIFLLIPVAMYFLLIRPQRRRQREQTSLQSAIDVGDEVMTTSGMYGFITGFDGDIVWLEVDDNVQVRVARAAVQRKVDTAAGETATPSDDGSGKASKIEHADTSGADETGEQGDQAGDSAGR